MNSGVLEGITVIDAATLVAGPMIATYLGEYGADVIKLEQPGAGDPIRQWGAMKDDVNLMWKSIGRNKRTASLNLRVHAGQELFRDIVAKADVLIVNTRPSTLKKWGLNYDELRAVNPGLVMVHVTGYGAGGPMSDKPGFGTIGEAMSGFSHITGEADGAPVLPGFMLADCTAAVHGAYAVMLGLFHRERTGTGQFIDLSLVEPLARFIEQATLTFDQLGVSPRRTGNKWPISVPRNTYLTSDDHWLALSGSAQTIALRVYDAIERPELKEQPDFADPLRRIANRDAVDDLVAGWIKTHTVDEVMARFDECGVAAGPVYDAEQLINDPQMIARNTFLPIPDEELGSLRVQAPVARLSETPGKVDYLGRAIGADNDYVYGKLLDLDPADIERLAAADVI
ncbi:CaiB/BaiF CoA transferase family protein (plasmid) [Rhodococcoides fascians]|uniref:CaiB/BaiF CoA transferase family protein n=1 Tax=Rhodococcoides fascians TaxID=1828 RepID=UPI00389B149A